MIADSAQPGPLTFLIEAVEKGNPRGLNRKTMKQARKAYRSYRKLVRISQATGKLLRNAA